MKILLIFALILLLAACGQAEPPTEAPLPTLADLPTLTPTRTPEPTGTPTASLTPTITPTPTLSPTVTLTLTPSATITDTITPTPTNTITPTAQANALSPLVQLALQATILPPTYLPPPATIPPAGLIATPAPGAVPSACTTAAEAGFNAVYTANPSLAAQLGCPVTISTANASAVQQYERGSMIWLNGPIYALNSSGTYRRFDDTFVPGVDAESGGEVPPPGLIEPVRGFGKVWRSSPDVRSGLGWATTPEAGAEARTQRFERGWLIYLPQRGDILALIEDAGGAGGTWQALPGTF